MYTRRRLAKTGRLVTTVDYARAMKQGLKIHNSYFTVYAITNPYQYARLGMIVSRKISLKAVVRNCIKRQIRESFRHHQDLLIGLDIVVAAQRKTATSDTRTYRDSLDKYWKLVAQKCIK